MSDGPPLSIFIDLRWAEGNLTRHDEPSSVLHRTESQHFAAWWHIPDVRGADNVAKPWVTISGEAHTSPHHGKHGRGLYVCGKRARIHALMTLQKERFRGDMRR